MSGRSFGSDNHSGAHPAVLAAVLAANSGDAAAYGSDDVTAAATAALRDATGAVSAHLVFTGTAANVLGLSLLVRPYEGAICADSSHLNVDECGAPERIIGCKLLPVPAPDGKLTPALVAGRLGGRGDEHHVQPRVIQIAQATEAGTCYSLEELRALKEFGEENELLIYLDGARIANAAASLGCSLADIAACADVLSFGGTKNGALGVEAVLVMTPGLDDGIRYQRKQQMQLVSKMRFLAAQVAALMEDDLWLACARRANEMAERLGRAVSALPGVRLVYPVEANAVFAELDREHAQLLQQERNFEIWSERPGGRCTVRWMTAFDTSEADVDDLVAAVSAVAVSRET